MTLTVRDPGLLTTVQDRGRRGLAHLGVARAGALDAPAAELANRLVGNGPDAAVLETTMTGLALHVGRATTLAVTGAPARVRVDGRLVAFAEPLSVRAGAELAVGPALRGVRSYLAVAGGIGVPPVLGSRSTDTLAWVGPRPLATGDVLPVGAAHGPPAPVDAPRLPVPGRELRLLPGPRADWVAPESWAGLAGSAYEVAAAADRVGLRLEGPALRRRTGELPSEGIVLGAVQLPPSGQPLVFLNDHPVTGGYPVVAVVHPDDLPTCAQLRPGDRVGLRLLSPPGRG